MSLTRKRVGRTTLDSQFSLKPTSCMPQVRFELNSRKQSEGSFSIEKFTRIKNRSIQETDLSRVPAFSPVQK